MAVGLAALFIVLAHSYAFEVFAVSTGSMEPTLRPEDFVFVDRLTYDFVPPRRGDLIVFHYPQADGHAFLKRVIGIPGDTVAERDGRFWVNGVALGSRSGVQTQTVGVGALPDTQPFTVPAGQFFVLGDNLSASLDSRSWGTVSIHDVVGKALFVLWSHGPRWWDIRWGRIGRWL